MELKVGSVVRLKSGGPRMTVEAVEDGEVHCEWFTVAMEHPGNHAYGDPVSWVGPHKHIFYFDELATVSS